jgi:hypothetical protein
LAPPTIVDGRCTIGFNYVDWNEDTIDLFFDQDLSHFKMRELLGELLEAENKGEKTLNDFARTFCDDLKLVEGSDQPLLTQPQFVKALEVLLENDVIEEMDEEMDEDDDDEDDFEDDEDDFEDDEDFDDFDDDLDALDDEDDEDDFGDDE